MESDSELLFQGGEKREKGLGDLLLQRGSGSTGLERPELEAVVEPDAQNNDALSREPVLLAAPILCASSICIDAQTHTGTPNHDNIKRLLTKILTQRKNTSHIENILADFGTISI